MGSEISEIYGGGLLGELNARIHQLESEKQFIEKTLELTKQQLEQEKHLVEDSYQKQLKLQEETFARRETRLRHENELMSEEILDKMKMMEREKSEFFAMHLKKQSELEVEQRNEIERLKANHRIAMEDLQREHQVALERVIKAKEAELNAMAHSKDHARNLELAINRMEENANDLQELQSKVEFKHNSLLNEREVAASARDENLKVLQDRLERQQHSNEMERARLQGLVTKLELQLTEQTRELEQEKWRVRQEESSLKIAQSSLEQERLRVFEQMQRDRMELDRLKEQLLVDQQRSLTELNEERTKLAKEKAEFGVEQRLKNEMQQRSAAKTVQSEAEHESMMRALSDERSRLTVWKHELEVTAEKVRADSEALEQRRRLADVEKRKLEQLAQQLRDNSVAVDELVNNATAAQEGSQKMYAVAKQLETEHNNRLARIQNELQALHMKQKQIAEERLSLAREKSALDSTKNSALCSICRTPIRDGPTESHPASSVPVHADDVMPMLIPASQYHPTSVPAANASSFRSAPLSRIYEAIQQDRTIRLWRIAANRDKDFLEEESYFLDAVKHAPYHLGQKTD
jgi:Fas-binding factor 1